MGAAVSCAQFEKFSVAVQWILQNKFAVKFMSHILDDFLFFGHPGTNECKKGLQSFLMLADSLGLKVKPEKTVWPSTKVEMHGILFDTDAMTLSLPTDKMAKAKSLIDDLFKRRKVKLVQIQQLHGFLNFACRAVAPGRTFLRRVANLMIGVSKPNHFIRMNKEIGKDLQAWRYFLDKFNNTPILPHIDWAADANWKLFSDASGRGYASVFGHKWFVGEFPDRWLDKSIAVKELTPIYLSFILWIDYFKNQKICFLVDNLSVVNILKTKTSKCPILMSMVRKMVVVSMLNNAMFSAIHIPGRHNVISDGLSRFQFDKVTKLAPWLDAVQTKVPGQLFPWRLSQMK
ncbi:MAG: hypothetical protein GY705_26160 [Bacteroidetes bacterium]|nr:hypothetical protein [Bacteroidota bacterium]